VRETANLCLQKAHYAARAIDEIPGFSLAYGAPFFNEFVVRTPVPAAEVNRHLMSGSGIVGGLDLGRFDPAHQDCLLLACTELTTRQEIDDLVAALHELQPAPSRSQPKEHAGVVGGAS
jgi:glycine dehydrogenase subunit 1